MRKPILTVLTVLLFTGVLLFFMQPSPPALGQTVPVPATGEWNMQVSPKLIVITTTVGVTTSQYISYLQRSVGQDASWHRTMIPDVPPCWQGAEQDGTMSGNIWLPYFYKLSGYCFPNPGVYTRTMVFIEKAAPGQPEPENPGTTSFVIELRVLPKPAAPSPKLEFSTRLISETVESNGFITWTQTITNSGEVTGTTVTTLNIGAGISQVIFFDAGGDYVTESPNVKYIWQAEVGPGKARRFILRAQVLVVNQVIDFPSALAWKIPHDEIVRGFTIVPPQWQFDVDSTPFVQSGDPITFTVTVTNPSDYKRLFFNQIIVRNSLVNQNAVTVTKTLGDVRVEKGLFDTMYKWAGDLPAQSSATFIFVAKTVKVEATFIINHYFSWILADGQADSAALLIYPDELRIYLPLIQQ